MKYRLLLLKRILEDLAMLPLILLGRLWSILYPLNRTYRVYYFFPFYHTGGAEKVHAMVAKATGGPDCIIYFTRRSGNEGLLQKFRESGCDIRDISRYTDNKLQYFVNIFFRGVVSGHINRQQEPPIVFNGQCNFGYKISPWIANRVRQIELIHSVSNFSYIRIPFLPFIAKTVMISRQKIAEHLEIYTDYGIPKRFSERIVYIPNASEFEAFDVADKGASVFRVLYSGRATTEKRTQLVVQIAALVHQQDKSIRFSMAGDTFSDVDRDAHPYIDYEGIISDERELAQVYQNSHVLLLTSSTEGFPLAVIEGMAYGCAVLATPVGDIPAHIKPGENGLLFSSVTDEEAIVREGVAFILQCRRNNEAWQKMATNNIRYAQRNFGYQRFAGDYKKLICV